LDKHGAGILFKRLLIFVEGKWVKLAVKFSIRLNPKLFNTAFIGILRIIAIEKAKPIFKAWLMIDPLCLITDK
jgi:hypothetical protein